MIELFDVLIVGAGHGGAQTAIELRREGFLGSVAIVGDEPELPYERPPLSKDYLAGDVTFESIAIRPLTFWREQGVAVLTGRCVTSLDSTAHEVMLSDDCRLGYRQLVWAAGGRARRLECSGRDLRGVHNVRSHADVLRLMTELPSVRRALVIDGGFIGLEAAAVLRELGKEVVLLEAADRVLARAVGRATSRFFEEQHRRRGVDVRLEIGVACIEGCEGQVTGVRLADGEVLPCDMAITGIGIEPSVGPLLAAGAQGGNGVRIDARCGTSLPDVFAVGDCALHASRFADHGEVRVESVQNANDQARVAALNVMGGSALYEAMPWFWSNQYDLRLQIAGLSTGHDIAVLRGDPSNSSFSVVYLKEGRVLALDCVNAPRDFVQGRALVSASAVVDPALVANADVQLRAAVVAAT